ncbi:MAG TPA: M48 family metallopeptidase [Thermodesulfobacteriota bacterium]|nr:M48 family metallopeptidase [Thermodesulfobacteriota bacterium]
MRSKFSKPGLHACLCLLAILVVSCATPTARVPLGNNGEIQEEARKQRILALKTQMEAQQRLYDVATPVLAGASPLCSDKRFYGGFMFAARDLFQPEYREAASELYGLKDLPRIIQVVEDSPAFKSDLRVGDEIISVNGQLLTKETKETQKVFATTKGSPSLILEVQREDLKLTINIDQEACCNYPVRLVASDEVNALADGINVYVTRGMMKFVNNDLELATIISHEVAHNARGHLSMTKKNALAGGFLGLVLDVAAAAAGVNTQGGFARMGAQIGRSTYSKDMEREADYVGLYILALSGYDIKEAPNVFRRLASVDPKSIEAKYAASHPSAPERFIGLEKTVEEILGKQSAGAPLIPEEKGK